MERNHLVDVGYLKSRSPLVMNYWFEMMEKWNDGIMLDVVALKRSGLSRHMTLKFQLRKNTPQSTVSAHKP